MPDLIHEDDFLKLKQSLPAAFQQYFINDERVLIQAYPLLTKLCPERDLIQRLHESLNVTSPAVLRDVAHQLPALCDLLECQFNREALFYYRLPSVLSEFPIHSRAINKAIADFNQVIIAYHRSELVFQSTELPVNVLSDNDSSSEDELLLLSHHAGSFSSENNLEKHYQAVFQVLKERGVYCTTDTLNELLSMLVGWSTLSPAEVFKADPSSSAIEGQPVPSDISPVLEENPVVFAERAPLALPSLQNPYREDNTYSFNGAGRLARETVMLLLNAFGLKLGGHFDAYVKYPPQFLFINLLHALIHRQLSHRMEVWPSHSFQSWLEMTLHELGIAFLQKKGDEQAQDLLVNPFFTKPISFLSPEKIKSTLHENLGSFLAEELKSSDAELDILAQYLFELLQGFQINPGRALGIGANFDGTVNLSNDASAYAFKILDLELANMFVTIAAHRQGPLEAYMNAAVGVSYEFGGGFAGFDFMTQLSHSEREEVILNALLDNGMTTLFPEPPYFENLQYQKYYKEHVVFYHEDGTKQINTFIRPSDNGTYFQDRSGNVKQTPMYRRAGTLDVLAFPKNTTYCEQSRESYAGNPLGPLQMQYAQSMNGSTRGHIVYDPIADDQFLEDPFYGQVLRSDNGDFLPFIGVIPKNFDKHFHQDSELCASFVVRMLQSARIMVYCPTFKHAFEQILTRFLPPRESILPALPEFCGTYLVVKFGQLQEALAGNDRTFIACHQLFYSLFNNLIYGLYAIGRDDEHFKHSYLSLINSKDTCSLPSRSKCDKLIRDLTVNRPVSISAELLARYDETLRYLRELITFFYPQPSDAMAMEINRQARLHVRPLFLSPGVTAYFEAQQLNRQANLSKKQSPGMLFAELRYGGPSKSIARDYDQMHQYNFPSYYLDPDGTPIGTPQINDRLMDWSAKKAGALIQIIHRYHLFAVINNPLVAPFVYAKQRMAAHKYDRSKPLWGLVGAAEGFLWHGLVKGAWQTAITPIQMIIDFFNWQIERLSTKKIKSRNNPLAISAAPANDLNVKSEASANSRDYLLQLLGVQSSADEKRAELITHIIQLAKKLHPSLSDEERELCRQKLEELFPLNEMEWADLFKPPINSTEIEALFPLLQHYNPFINKSLIQSVFRCLTNPLFSRQATEIIKDTCSFFALSAKQKKVLTRILALYEQLPSDKKDTFLSLFSFEGEIHQSLQIRDHYLQKMQSFMLIVFDAQWVLEILLANSINRLILELDQDTLNSTIIQLPNRIKWPLHSLLTLDEPNVLCEYALSEEEVALIFKIQECVQHILEQTKKEDVLACCRVEQRIDEKTLSVKDRAHNKWAKFAERELKHELLDLAEANDVFMLLLKKLKNVSLLKSLLEELHALYPSLSVWDDEAVIRFYTLSRDIDTHLFQLQQAKKTADAGPYQDAQILLNNFTNISMNAIINARLDQIDVFTAKSGDNPLLAVPAIITWLSGVQKNNQDLRSLMEQQIQQAPSLDHTLWRCKCILQAMEQPNPGAKIAKTGMQSLLRFWSQHNGNVTTTGEPYIHPMTSEMTRVAPDVLFHGSVTLQHSMERVREKLPAASFFNRPPSVPVDEDDDNEPLPMARAMAY